MPRPSRWDDVVAAAARVFSDKGFGGSSLEDVAAEVGMLKGSLYNYIRSKEDLLFAVVRPDAEQLLASARDLVPQDLPASEKLRMVATVHVEIIDRHLPYVHVYVQEVAGKGISAEWAQMDREYMSLVERLFEEGKEAGDFDDKVDVRVAARSFVGALNWMTRWYEPGGPEHARAMATQVADLFLGGLLRRRQR